MEADPQRRRARTRSPQQLGRRVRLARRTCRTDPASPRPSAARCARSAPARRRTPVAAISARIFASSSAQSSTKSRTPCRAQASRIAPRALIGCMKWMSASGNMSRTRRISGNEAQSKCRTPPSHSARSTAGSGLHFTAYSTSPGKPSTKSRAVSRDGGRPQAMHRLLRTSDGDHLIHRGAADGIGHERTAQRRDSGTGTSNNRHRGNPRGTSRTRGNAPG